MKSALRVKPLVDRLEEGILALLLAFMTLITFVQVVLRYVFNSGLVWSLEATTYSFAWLLLIGISYGVRVKAHIAVDIVTNRLPKNTQRVFALLATALCLLYAGLMFYGSFVLIDRMYMLGNFARDIALPKWLLTGIMPVGFALLAFRFFQVGLLIFKGENIGPADEETLLGVESSSNLIDKEEGSK